MEEQNKAKEQEEVLEQEETLDEPLPKSYIKNGIEYLLDEEQQVYYPQLGGPVEPPEPIGKYGHLRHTFLKEHDNRLYQKLIMQGTLFEHLHEIDVEAHRRIDTLLPKMKEADGVTEELKEHDQMRWVGLMENIYAQIDEMIFEDLIYVKSEFNFQRDPNETKIF